MKKDNVTDMDKDSINKRENMRLLIIILSMFLPFSALAQSALHPVNGAFFQKDLYKKLSEKAIEGGEPVNGQTFVLTENGKPLGTFIAGKGYNAREDNVCFIGWSEKKTVVKTVIPTIGFDDWEGEVCNQTRSVGIISDKDDANTKIAVIYEAASPNAIANEAVIFTIDSAKGDIELDKVLTTKIGSSGAKTIKELKNNYRSGQR